MRATFKKTRTTKKTSTSSRVAKSVAARTNRKLAALLETIEVQMPHLTAGDTRKELLLRDGKYADLFRVVDAEIRTYEAITRAQHGDASTDAEEGRRGLSAVTQAVEKGDAEAALQLATYYDPTIEAPPAELGPEEMPAKSVAKAAKYYRLAANSGNVEAAFGLGWMFTTPEVQGAVQQRGDFEEGVRWLKYAKARGDRDAEDRLRDLMRAMREAMQLPGCAATYAPVLEMLLDAKPMTVPHTA